MTFASTLNILQHLRGNSEPFVLRRGQKPAWSDAELHAAAFQADPVRYALSGLAEGVQAGQQARVLHQLLASSWANFTPEVRDILERAVVQLLRLLNAEQALTVFLALRRVRANHKHTSRAILRYLLRHPRLEHLAALRRPALVDCLEHALGKNTARGCARRLREQGAQDAYVQQHLLRHAAESHRVESVIAFLYGTANCPIMRADGNALTERSASEVAPAEKPKTVTATNRGDIAATLVHMYNGGTNQDLKQALNGYVAGASADLPRFQGKVGLVLDASASTLGYGERQFCCVSQSQALRLVLQRRCCEEVRVRVVGRDEELPRPEGDSDLASALLDVLESDPDVVAVVSDGYENVLHGDLARIVASLPGAGVTTPVVFCHSKFTDKDDLTMRRPAPGMTQLEFWHQADFGDLLWSLFAASRAPHGERFLEAHLQQRLAKLEKEGQSWISN